MKGELEYCILKEDLLPVLLRDFMDTKNAMIGKYLRGHHVSGPASINTESCHQIELTSRFQNDLTARWRYLYDCLLTKGAN